LSYRPGATNRTRARCGRSNEKEAPGGRSPGLKLDSVVADVRLCSRRYK